MMNQGSGNEEILNMARDYFHFVTKFFEPISVSATHIYHSTLELSPLSSIVRRLYYHQRHTSPRVIFGKQDSWDQWLTASSRGSRWDRSRCCAWSPCGQFIAVGYKHGMEIYDSLSLEHLSTLMPTKSDWGSMDQLAYSMDGRSVASAFGTLLTVWDIQTGGVAKEIEYKDSYIVALAWSLNGSTIGTISYDWKSNPLAVCTYNVASGTTHSYGTLPLTDRPYLWACDASFRAMTTARDNGGLIINIFEVGTVLTKIESFRIGSLRGHLRAGSFSQSTYRISISVGDDYFVFDIRTSHRLLSAKRLESPRFSSDGNLFADILAHDVHIWKYTSDGYTPWRQFPLQFPNRPLQFSPTSSSLLTHSEKILQLWRLDGPPIVAHPDYYMPPLIILSHCVSYMAAGDRGGRIVTITDLLSQTPLHSIDTGMWIYGLALTGNVLLVWDLGTIAAWRLTEDGSVDGVSIDRRAGRGDSIWIVPLPSSRSDDPIFSFGDQTVAIRKGEEVVHVYCTETGEVLESTQTLLYHHDYSSGDMLRGLHHPHHHDIDPVAIKQMGWMKDPEGKYRLWIPVKWRNSLQQVISSYDRKIMRLDPIGCDTILIKF